MTLLGTSRQRRIEELAGFVLLLAALFLLFCLASYHAFDPSWNTVTESQSPRNLTGLWGAYTADLLLQTLGLSAFWLPAFMMAVAWKWVRHTEIPSPWRRAMGGVLFLAVSCVAFGLIPSWNPVASPLPAGGLIGSLLAGMALHSLNLVGTLLVILAGFVVALYTASSFELAWLHRTLHVPQAAWTRVATAFHAWMERRREARAERKELKAREKAEKLAQEVAQEKARAQAEEKPKRERRAKKTPQRSSSTRPAARPLAVNLRSALSMRSYNRCSARDVNILYGSSVPFVTRSSIKTPIYASDLCKMNGFSFFNFK